MKVKVLDTNKEMVPIVSFQTPAVPPRLPAVSARARNRTKLVSIAPAFCAAEFEQKRKEEEKARRLREAELLARKNAQRSVHKSD